ncbi:MAG TPA: HAMP domain-containing sensor histidine kinase [Dyadobacter sp.]|nr:HAMP domain-containing sensor histidine kinase [Dyadobacter sp.]
MLTGIEARSKSSLLGTLFVRTSYMANELAQNAGFFVDYKTATSMRTYNSASLQQVTNYLFSRREAILNNWRVVCEQDKDLGSVGLLSRQEFNNLIPAILDILEQRLMHQVPKEDLTYVAEGHGLHRWHKALALIESMKELNHLAEILYEELDTYDELYPDTDKGLLLFVQRTITSVMQQTFTGSVHKYDELQRLHAAGRLNSLQGAVEKMNELTNARGQILRKSSHDLRGGVGIVSSAAALLSSDGLSQDERDMYLEMLNRNVVNIQSLLEDLLDLSRLESGQETLKIESVDVGALLLSLVEGAQSMARQKGIVLRADGPTSMIVQTDRIKLQRIAQNILLNALSYTTSRDDVKGIVSVSWSSEGRYRWILGIQDSGPGIDDDLLGVYYQQLRPTTEPTALMSPDQAEPDQVRPVDIPQVPSGEELGKLSERSSKGEGVGLQIVKHLCELLNASMDIESIKGRGTLFRVRMPVHLETSESFQD